MEGRASWLLPQNPNLHAQPPSLIFQLNHHVPAQAWRCSPTRPSWGTGRSGTREWATSVSAVSLVVAWTRAQSAQSGLLCPQLGLALVCSVACASMPPVLTCACPFAYPLLQATSTSPSEFHGWLGPGQHYLRAPGLRAHAFVCTCCWCPSSLLHALACKLPKQCRDSGAA